MTMTFGSLFDGIGAFSLGLRRAGMKQLWSVEIDRDCRRVTAARFPGVPQYEDINHCGKENLERVDVVVGGSPCQGFSVAGKGGGLADGRSGLFSQMARVVDEIAPRWVIWENVPGCFSENGGEDFAAVLAAFSGYEPEVPKGGWLNSGVCIGRKRACAWGVLDCQHFGLAQRRKRVFVVCRSGDSGGLDLTQPGRESGRLRGLPWRVLLVGAGMPRDTPPRREAGPGVARATATGAGGEGDGRRGEGSGERVVGTLQSHAKAHGHAMTTQQAAESGHLVVSHDVAPALQEREGKGQDSSCTRVLADEDARASEPQAYSVQATYAEGRGPHAREAEVAKTIDSHGGNPDCQQGGTLVAYTVHSANSCAKERHAFETERAKSLDTTGGFASGQGGTLVGYNVIGGAQNSKNHAYETDVSGCLQSKGLSASGNEAGTLVLSVPASETPAPETPVLAFQERGREGGRNLETQEELAYALTNPGEGGRAHERNILAPTAFNWQGGGTQTTLGFDPESDITGALSVGQTPAVAFGIGSDAVDGQGESVGFCTKESGAGAAVELSPTIRAESGDPHMGGRTAVANSMTVRRLTPTECLRLMGLPDDWQDIDPPLSDSARYRQLGNAGGVPVLTWIGLGIMAAEHGWLSDADFLAIREMSCRGRDLLAIAAVCDFIEERTGVRPAW